MKRSRFPEEKAVDYYRAIKAKSKQLHNYVKGRWESEIKPIAISRKDSLSHKVDDMDWLIAILESIEDHAWQIIFTTQTISNISTDFVTQIQLFTYNQIGEQIKSVIGLDPISRSPTLHEISKSAVRANISLIKSIPQEYLTGLDTVILQNVRRGESLKTIEDAINKLQKVSEKRAKFIARDQVGSLMGDLTKARQTALGLEYFIWHNCQDILVRGNPNGKYPNAKNNHWKLEGKKFKWKEGAPDIDGLIPGQDYGCRCTGSVDPEEVKDKLG